MKVTWWKEAVVYQIYPRSFKDSNGDGIGDLRGIITKLDYLKELGVDVIWLSPIYRSPNDDNGYDISDYCDIMEEFGTMAEFDLLLEEMHKRGLKLMMDLVVNHTSDEHPWFQAALKDKTSPYRDYYFFRDGKPDGLPPNNWCSHFGFSAWEKEPDGDQYFLHLYTKKQPDLNWDNPAVREEVYRIMQFWTNKGNDGKYRLESAKMLATFLHTLQGTPYIYQGEELGMTNIRFDSIDQYKDIDTLNHYAEAVSVFHEDPKQVMEAIYAKGRDNARTPMQWDALPEAGFTDGIPWIPVNPNYVAINAEEAIRNPESIFHYYQALIRLRKKHKVIVYGNYRPLCEDHPAVYAYTRQYQGQMLLVLLNFFADLTAIDIPQEYIPVNSFCLIGNYEDSPACGAHVELRAFEAVVFLGGEMVGN